MIDKEQRTKEILAVADTPESAEWKLEQLTLLGYTLEEIFKLAFHYEDKSND